MYKSHKLNNFIVYASIISANLSSWDARKCYVTSLKDTNNIDIIGKVT